MFLRLDEKTNDHQNLSKDSVVPFAHKKAILQKKSNGHTGITRGQNIEK